jgi:carbamoyl-phosphate synthase large subunit
MPRFAFEKFPQADDRLTTQMKSVGEVMAIGRTFQESLQKALRGWKSGVDGFDERGRPIEMKIEAELGNPGPERIWYVADAFRVGMTLEEVHALTQDRSLVPGQIEDIVELEKARWPARAGGPRRATNCALKRKGFSDRRLAKLLGTDQHRGARAA